MPVFKIAGQPAYCWFPRERVIALETAPGGLTTNVRALVITDKGTAVGVFEVEGRCDVIGSALERGEPVLAQEVGS